MKPVAIFLMYIGMLVFDTTVLAGTVYLIEERGWSAWWVLAAVIIGSESSPRRIIETASGLTAKAPGGQADVTLATQQKEYNK